MNCILHYELYLKNNCDILYRNSICSTLSLIHKKKEIVTNLINYENSNNIIKFKDS
jgi:hypothetical protein